MCAVRHQALCDKARAKAKKRQEEAAIRGNISRSGKKLPVKAARPYPVKGSGQSREDIAKAYDTSGRMVQKKLD